MVINENNPKEKRGDLFRAWNDKGVSPHHGSLAETYRQAGKWESFVIKKKKKKEGLGCALI